MAIINNVNEVLHRVRVKLYPNYLQAKIPGEYIARTDSEAALSVEDVCAALKNRGGFTGNYEDLVEYVRQYLDEAAYQLCDGFAVNTGYFSIHPNVGGTFDKKVEGISADKHPLSFRFRARSPLRTLAEHIEILVEGVADTGGYLDEFTDVKTGAVNESLTPGGLFSLTGHKIKIAGEGGSAAGADIGVYFVLPGDPVREFKVTENLAENTPSKIIGAAPADLIAADTYRVEVRTRYSGSLPRPLKELRVIAGGFTLSVEEEKGGEEGWRGKREEGRGKREEGRGKRCRFRTGIEIDPGAEWVSIPERNRDRSGGGMGIDPGTGIG